RWGDPAALDTLACVLCGDGLSGKRLAAFEALLRNLENTRAWRERDQQLQRLRTRQSQIEGQLDQARRAGADGRHSVLKLDERIETCGRRLVRVQKNIELVEEQLAAHRSATRIASVSEASKTALHSRLHRIGQRVERVQLVLEDLSRRSHRLRQLIS